MIGKVKHILPAGFGFLELQDGDRQVFFHQLDLQRQGLAPARIGDVFRFDIVEGKKGPKAANLSRPSAE
jgi:cold shock CspA family protein